MFDLDMFIDKELPLHPFGCIPDNADYRTIMANYFAMSQAFPYLQAGSQKELFWHYIDNNTDIPNHIELTTVVGNFLCWDETGGLNPTVSQGLKALPRILETKRFHSNLLRKDCITIFGKPFHPDYSDVTKGYLMKLYSGLASLCPITRVAYMVSFENHANRMISALWDSLAKKFNVKRNVLKYFLVHVGGNDPAEAYHVEMTKKLIEKTVEQEKIPDFYNKFKEAYQSHHQWCDDIVKLGLNH